MSTSNLAVVTEAAGGAVVITAVVALWSPGDLAMTAHGYHPAWLPILLVAARYGTRGLFVSLGLVWGLLLALGLALHGNAALAAFGARATSSANVLALGGAIVVAWVALLHERRVARATATLDEALRWRKDAEETIAALHETATFLRARNDRIDVSLTLWRDLAGRIERGDPVEASRAALELCQIRTGATAGMVQTGEEAHRRTIAWRGQWSASSPRPRDVFTDRTAVAARARRQPTSASEVDGSTSEDSDVAVPVLDDAGGVTGVIALRGVSPGRLREADLRDLVVIAAWLGPALAAAPPRHRTSPQGLRP